MRPPHRRVALGFCRIFNVARGRQLTIQCVSAGLTLCVVLLACPLVVTSAFGSTTGGVYSRNVGGGSGLGNTGPPRALPVGSQAVSALFTAKSRTYKTPQGIYTTTIYGQPVNVKQADGTWKPIEGSTEGAARPAGGGSSDPIDATVSSTASHDCALASNSPTTSICNATTNTVGYDGTNTDNSLVEFELKEAVPSGANVLNAQLGMYLSSSSTTNPVSVSAYAATKEWTLSATWNTYDGTNAWTASGGDFSATNAVVNPSVTTPAGWAHWYPTQIVQEWVNGTLPNDGLLLADTTQKTTNDMLSFNSLNATSNFPYLAVSWEPRGLENPGMYSMQSLPLDDRSAIGVNLASGNLYVTSNDLNANGIGVPFLAEHNYDSLNTEGGSVNPWYSLPGAEVYADGSLAVGLNHYDFATFIRKADGSFLTPAGINATMCAVNGTTCKGNSVDTSAAYALTFNEPGNGPLYGQGNKIDFGSNGGILSDADRNGNSIVYHYGSFGISSITDTKGRTFTRTQVETGGKHVTSAWTEPGTGGRKVKYAYNASSNLESFTDAAGQVTKYAYDEENELSEVTDPRGSVTKLNYDSSHRIIKVTLAEAGGAHPDWDYAYYLGSDKEAGHGHACTAPGVTKKTVVKNPTGHESTFCANVEDEVLQSFDPEGNESTAAFNALGQVASYQNPGDTAEGAGGTITNAVAYNTSGAPTEVSFGTGTSTTLNTKLTYGGGTGNGGQLQPSSVQTPYSAAIQKSAKTHQTFFGYDASGNLTSVNQDTEAGNPAVKFVYNAKGQPETSTDPNGNVTKYKYNETSHDLVKIEPPSPLGATELTYDSAERVHTIKDGRGNTATYTYDADDRVTKVEYSDGSSVSFKFDADGNTTERVDAKSFGEPYTGATLYEYDRLNRPTLETTPTGKSIRYGYDLAGNLTSLQDAGGTVSYGYGPDNVLTSLTEPENSAHPFTFGYEKGDDNRESTKFPNGLLECTKTDPGGRLTKLVVFKPTGEQNCSSTISPSSALEYYGLWYSLEFKEGEKTEAIDTPDVQKIFNYKAEQTTTYSYDSLDRLLEAVTTNEIGGATTLTSEYAYDNTGNMLLNHTFSPSTTYTNEHMKYNAANEICAIATTTPSECAKPSEPGIAGDPTYDANGNMTSDGLLSGANKFAYTVRNQLSSITPHGESARAVVSHGTGQVDLAAIGSEEVITNILGVGATGSGEGAKYYTRGSEGALLAKRTAKGKPSETEYFTLDPFGSVAVLTNSSGAQTAPASGSYQYDPYGQAIGAASSTYGYGSGQVLPAGLVHYGARYYSPSLGQWTQPEGAYSFAGDDPINNADSNGECFADRFGTWGPDCAGNPFITTHGSPPQTVYKCFKVLTYLPHQGVPSEITRCVPKRGGLQGCLRKVFSPSPFKDLGEATAFAFDILTGGLVAEAECFVGAREVVKR